MKSTGEELNYSSVEREHLNLTRAAAWHFGNWRGAVEAAGIEYDDIRKYRRWSRERVLARIRELHKSGADLNWRAVSTQVDPSLAAAALRIGDFATWRDAIAAAGLDIENVARYRFWDEARVLAALRDAREHGDSLSSKAAQQRDQPLFCAARRRFGTWNNALQSAGITPQKRGGGTRASAAEARVPSPVKSAEKSASSQKVAAPQAASTRGAKDATPKPATSRTTRPSATIATTKAAPPKSTPAKSVGKTSAVKKEAAPSVASTRAAKSSLATKASAAKSAPKSGAAKIASTVKVSTAKAPSAKTSSAKAPAVKAPAAKTAASSAAKAPAAKVVVKAPVAKTSAVKAAAKPAATKSAKTSASRAAKK